MQPFFLTTISNSSNHTSELNHDFKLACMLVVIINPVSNHIFCNKKIGKKRTYVIGAAEMFVDEKRKIADNLPYLE